MGSFQSYLRKDEQSELRRLISSPKMDTNPVSGFTVAQAGGAVNVGFSVTSTTGISGVVLLRASVMDFSVATVIQTWSPVETMAYAFSDSANIASLPQVYYWLRLEPVGASGKSYLIGPQQLKLNPDFTQPDAPLTLSVSHDAARAGTITCYAVVGGVPSEETVRILVNGYQGGTSPVAIAQSATSPITFNLVATGETVTVTAEAVSLAGVASSPSPPATLVLSPTATVPASIAAPTVVQFSGGNQISWSSSPEPSVTAYKLYRGQRGDAFGTATVLATVSATTSRTVNYTDTVGLLGDYAYYVVAVSPAGNSDPSPAGLVAVFYSSTVLPPNVSAAVSNNATIDSVSFSGAALIRVYGPGGIGTSYTHYAGSANLTRPNGTISGNAYNTAYAIVYDTVLKSYIAYLQTNYPATLPDQYEFVGYYTTVSTGSAPGSGATATAVIGTAGTVLQVNVTASGSGYNATQVNFSGGGGSGAQATANLSFFGGNVNSITVNNGGIGYATAPTVTIVATDPGAQSGGGGASPIYVGGARYNSNPSTFGG